MPLTDSVIRKAKPAPTPYKLYDREGLYLIVNPAGSKWWRFKYIFGRKLATTGKNKGKLVGVEKGISLGSYPEVSLKTAREKRDEARKLVASKINPSAKRKAEKVADGDTFKAIAEEWLAQQAVTLQAETIAALRARFQTWVFGHIGNDPIAGIMAEQILAMLRRVEAKGRIETAHRIRAACGRVFRYAVASGRASRDPTADLKGALTPVKSEHHAAITDPPKVGELLRAIAGYKGFPATAIALKIAPYVFVRPGELRAAEWAEFHLTGDAPEWRIPAPRMKMRRAHIVPLASQVVALLKELETHTGGGKYAFPTSHDPMRSMSENTLASALRRLDYSSDEMTAHGFRTTASTLLNERGFNPELIELQLAHVEQNETRAAYNRSMKLAERRAMMQAWADYLDELRRQVRR